MAAIEDSFKRLSIYPLIKAGELSSISNAATVTPDDVKLTSGKIHTFMEGLVNKLPPSLTNVGRYALITKDTALYQGLHKSVEYGDFLAKALLYDDLTQRKGMSHQDAIGRVTDEFVNYDRLPGRFRGYLEKMGLLWFYNFKLRSAKVAMSMIRNNPVHTLLASAAPIPHLFGSVGLPTSDNIVTKLFSGQLGYSFGMGQTFHAPMLNPYVHILKSS